MTILQAIILGIVEGATEFIPVSSTGHLLIARRIMSLPLQGTLAFDAILQLAATVALIIYFRKDIAEIIKTFFKIISGKVVSDTDRIMVWSIILGTIPAVIFGLLLEKKMDTIFRNIHLVAWATLIGAGIIYLAQKLDKSNKVLSIGRGVMIGFFQCLALVPGISRSAATISGGLFAGLTREEAVRFSFLLGIPVLLGSGLKELIGIQNNLAGASVTGLIAGAVASFIVAWLAINTFIKFLKNHNFDIFVWYRVLLFFVLLFAF